MPLIEYPAGLPSPQAPLRLVPAPRRAASSIEGKVNVRNRQRDFAGGRYEAQWLYTPEQMATWRAWYEDTLLYGQLWFAATLPLDGGMAIRVVKYVGEERREHLARGIYRVTRSLEVRGASALPRISETPETLVTWDPGAQVNGTLTNNNLTSTGDGESGTLSYSTTGKSEGKWYVEIAVQRGAVAGLDLALGIANEDDEYLSMRSVTGFGSSGGGTNEFLLTTTATTNTGALLEWDDGDRVGIAVDLDNHRIFWSLNGVYGDGGNPTSGIAPGASGFPADTWRIFMRSDNDGTDPSATIFANGDSEMLYAPPAGFHKGYA
jgi:hypothetical protein